MHTPRFALALLWTACTGVTDESALQEPGTDTRDLDTQADIDTQADTDTQSDVDTDSDSDSDIGLSPCAVDTQLAWLQPVASFAVYGSLFSVTPYIPGDGDSHQPEPVRVRLTRGGQPVADCPITWSVDGAGDGWVHPIDDRTDADGTAAAWWVAADVPNPSLRASVTNGFSVALQGNASPGSDTRTTSMWLHYDVSNYDAIRIDVTPLTEAPTTYYSALNWSGAYAGIQFERTALDEVSCGGHFAATCGGCPQGNGAAWCNGDCAWVSGRCVLSEDTADRVTKVIFSTWDRDNITNGDAQLIDGGNANATTGFGGEGTGVSARLLLPPSVYGPIDGLPDDYNLVAGDTYTFELTVTHPDDCGSCSDYTLSFSDETRGLGPIALGTQRYQSDDSTTWAASFVEDWIAGPDDTCTNAGTRSARFHDVQVRSTDGQWTDVTRARVDAVYLPSNNELCANYHYRVEQRGFVLGAGGTDDVSPVLQNDAVWLDLDAVEPSGP